MADFIGRQIEINRLQDCLKVDRAQLVAVYGRRRIGKTRLVEEAFRECRLLKFEGLEGQTTAEQRSHFKATLAEHSGQRTHQTLQTKDWRSLLIALSDYLNQSDERTVVFFDEFQWMAAERTHLVSLLKYVWDNFYQKNNVILVVCGSISSFIVKKVIQSKALYGRIDLHIPLTPLSLNEIKEGFFPQAPLQQITEYWMALGGIPKYLEYCDTKLSFEQNMIKLFFSPFAPLQDELNNLFVSHFGKNPHYLETVKCLAERQFASREQIAKQLALSSGGGLSVILEELALAGFIEQYHSVHNLNAKALTRFRIADPFLRFYFKFFEPRKQKLKRLKKPMSILEALPVHEYTIWRGLAFEFLCYQHAHEIACALGFSGIDYEVGAYFRRADLKTGIQIDLIYDRADRMIVLCEVKFMKTVDAQVINEIERKVEALGDQEDRQIQAVLISAYKPKPSVLTSPYLTDILGLECFFTTVSG